MDKPRLGVRYAADRSDPSYEIREGEKKVLTRFRVGIEFLYKEAGKIKRYILPALFIFAQTRVRTEKRLPPLSFSA